MSLSNLRPPKGAKPAHYVIFRDGKSLGKTTRSSFTDTKVVPGKTYRYAVRAYGKDKKAGVLSSSVRVKVPLQASTKLPSNPGGPTTNPIGPIAELNCSGAP